MTAFSRFLLVGAIAAVANWLSRIALSTVLNLTTSVVLAYGVGITIAYLLNRQFVFGSSAPIAPELGRFVLVNMVSLLVVVMVTLVLSRIVLPQMGIVTNADTLAHAIGVASPVLLSYLGHSLFTFSTETQPR